MIRQTLCTGKLAAAGAAIFATGLLAAPSQAATVLGVYGFNGNYAPDSVVSGLIAGNAAPGSAITAATFASRSYEGTKSVQIGANVTPIYTPGDYSSESYYAFTLTPAAGYSVTIDSITWQDSTTDNSGTPGGWGVRSALFWSVDSTRLGSLGYNTDAVVNGPWQQGTATFATPYLLTGPVTFYLVVGDNTSRGDRFRLIDDIVINGSVVAVPAPAALPAGLALLGAMGFARRRG